MKYNYQQPDWPEFRYDLSSFKDDLTRFNELAWRISGLLKGIPPGQRADLIIDFMIAEAIKTSEIEGEFLSRQNVMSSICNNLGPNDPKEAIKDKRASRAANCARYLY